jgi:lysophospholipase L1-like esterase
MLAPWQYPQCGGRGPRIRLPHHQQFGNAFQMQKVHKPMQKIFIFGDSIAYGAWDPAGGWVERLRQWLFVTTRDEYNLGTFLYNLSIVGDTTADLLKRFTPEIGARQSGDIIFFAAGINDAQFVNGRPMATPAAVCTNVRTLIQRARAFAPLLCWVGLTPVDDAHTTPLPWMPDRAYRNATVAVFDAAIKRTVAEESTPYIGSSPLEMRQLIDSKRQHQKA